MIEQVTAYRAADGSLHLTSQAAESHDLRGTARRRLVTLCDAIRDLYVEDLEGRWDLFLDVCRLHAAAYPDPHSAPVKAADKGIDRALADSSEADPVWLSVESLRIKAGRPPIPKRCKPYRCPRLDVPPGSIVFRSEVGEGEDLVVRATAESGYYLEGDQSFPWRDFSWCDRVWVIAQGLTPEEARAWACDPAPIVDPSTVDIIAAFNADEAEAAQTEEGGPFPEGWRGTLPRLQRP